jgi:hypothetical protein
MFRRILGGHSTPARRARRQALAAGLAALALALSLVACGGGGSASNANETAASYPIEIVTAIFPSHQRLGETSLLELAVRNTGRRTIPDLTMTISVGGKQGQSSSLPFGYRDPSPEIAQPDRPVWALSADFPKVDGTSGRAGAETASPKTFVFGPLEPGETTEAIWKLSAVRTGRYVLLYRMGGGLGGAGKVETAPGTAAGGSFVVKITEKTPEVEVTDSGEVVEIDKGRKHSGK